MAFNYIRFLKLTSLWLIKKTIRIKDNLLNYFLKKNNFGKHFRF